MCTSIRFYHYPGFYGNASSASKTKGSGYVPPGRLRGFGALSLDCSIHSLNVVHSNTPPSDNLPWNLEPCCNICETIVCINYCKRNNTEKSLIIIEVTATVYGSLQHHMFPVHTTKAMWEIPFVFIFVSYFQPLFFRFWRLKTNVAISILY